MVHVMNEALLQTWSPVIQYGFAGFAVLLLGVVVWLIRQLLKVLKETGEIIRGNTLALDAVSSTAGQSRELMSQIRDQLLSRPCMLTEKELQERLQQHE